MRPNVLNYACIGAAETGKLFYGSFSAKQNRCNGVNMKQEKRNENECAVRCSPQQVQAILEGLAAAHPDAKPELNFSNPFELLIATILSGVTSAKPKIANYHFTTLTPNLGVVKRYDTSFVVADIPGLIEGAADGAGLGHDFLRHIERTRMLVHVLDISGSEGRDPFEDYCRIRSELMRYSDKLAELPELIVANKMDITGSEDNLEIFREELAMHIEEDKAQGNGGQDELPRIFPVSAATGKGFEPLLDAIVEMLKELPATREFAEDDIIETPQYERGFAISREGEVYTVTGGTVEYILDTTDADDEESMRRFQRMLKAEGIIDALREAGAGNESIVRMGEWEFDFIE